MRAQLVVAAVLLVVTGSTASAQKRTDVVTLLNGDHITGEIMNLDRGRLEFKTDDAGTMAIEWDKVAEIVATRQFEVATSDGRRVLGRLGGSTDRSLRIIGGEGEVLLPMLAITELAPIGTTLWARLDGSVDAGFTYTRSGGIAQTTFNSSTAFRRPAFQFRVTASATVTQRDDDGGRDDRASVEASYLRYRGRRWFVGGSARVETNESLGVVLRSQVGGAVGLRPLNSNTAQIEFAGGMVVNDERGVDAPPTQNIEGLLNARMSFYAYDRPRTNLDVSIQYYPSLSSWGRNRLQIDASLKREMLKDFFVGLNVFDTYDSDPPNATASHNDVGIVASVGWSY